MCSRIGDPINQPRLVSVRLHADSGAAATAQLAASVGKIVEQRIRDIDTFIEDLVSGKYRVC